MVLTGIGQILTLNRYLCEYLNNILTYKKLFVFCRRKQLWQDNLLCIMALSKCQEQQLVTSQLPKISVASTIQFIMMDETIKSLIWEKQAMRENVLFCSCPCGRFSYLIYGTQLRTFT